jgi:hypothetical protein
MRGLLIPFAIRRSDRRMVSPEEIPRGLACDCECPGCSFPLVAKQGTEKVWHFAHHRHPMCSDGYAKSIEALAKQLIMERLSLRLPALAAQVSGQDPNGTTLIERVLLYESKLIQLDECSQTTLSGEVAPDLVGQLSGHKIVIVISVVHRLRGEKHRRLIASSLPAVEIDLGNFRRAQATRTLLEDALFEESSNRFWIHHPKLVEAQAIAQKRLEERLAESRRALEVRLASPRIHAPMPTRNGQLSLSNGHNIVPSRAHEVPNSSPSATLTDGVAPAWRASLPDKASIQQAQAAFVQRTGIDYGKFSELTGQITRRSQLASISPADLTRRWATELNVEAAEIYEFLKTAGYVL